MVRTALVFGAAFMAAGLAGSVVGATPGAQTPTPTAPRAAECDGVRNARYCEVFVVTGRLVNVQGHVYNTLGLNDCPAAQWSALNTDALKAQLGVQDVILNGPRYWLMDRITIDNTGPIATFGGLDMHLVATIEIPLREVIGSRLGGGQRQPYTEHTIGRSTQWFFSPGRQVFELVAPDGRVYVMQSYAHIVDDSLTEAALPGLAPRLQLPAGWQYRVRTLDSELVVGTPGSEAHVIQDDFENTYQRLDG